MIDDDEPTIQGLYQPSVVITRRGRRIGIIGVIIATTNVSEYGDLIIIIYLLYLAQESNVTNGKSILYNKIMCRWFRILSHLILSSRYIRTMGLHVMYTVQLTQ